jgi:hypothetical protein
LMLFGIYWLHSVVANMVAFTFRPNSGSGPTTEPKCQRKYS